MELEYWIMGTFETFDEEELFEYKEDLRPDIFYIYTKYPVNSSDLLYVMDWEKKYETVPSCCNECESLDISGDYPVCEITGEQKGYLFIPKLRSERMSKCPFGPKEMSVYDRLNEYEQFMETSKWIKTHDGNGWNDWINIQCPYCKMHFEKIGDLTHYRFCPYCGKDMRGDKNGD